MVLPVLSTFRVPPNCFSCSNCSGVHLVEKHQGHAMSIITST